MTLADVYDIPVCLKLISRESPLLACQLSTGDFSFFKIPFQPPTNWLFMLIMRYQKNPV